MCFWFVRSADFTRVREHRPGLAGDGRHFLFEYRHEVVGAVGQRREARRNLVWLTASRDCTASPGPRRRALLLPLVRKSAGLLMRVTPPTRAMDSSLTGVPALTVNVISIRVGSAGDGRTDATCPTRMPANKTGVPCGDAAGVAQVCRVDHLSTHVLRCAHEIHRRAEDQQADDDEDADSSLQVLMVNPSQESGREPVGRRLAVRGRAFVRETGVLADDRVAEEFLARANRDESTVVQQRDPVANVQRALHRVRDHEHGHAEAAFQKQNELVEPGSDNRIESGRGLVEHEDVGIEGHGPGDRRALLHPARQLVRKEVALVRQTDGLELHPHHERDDRIGQLRQLLERQCHVLGDGHRTEQSRPLKGDADASANRGQLGCGTRR